MKYIIFLYLFFGNYLLATSQPQYIITSMHPQTSTIKVITQDHLTIFDVTSAFGIGKASINSFSGVWSKQICIRLHLKKLEGFSVSTQNIQLQKEDLEIKVYKTYYEVILPSVLFEDAGTTINVEWIDFYR